MSDAFETWERTTKDLKQVSDASPEALATIVTSLTRICSDLEEHGDLSEFGEGKYSVEDFFAKLDEAETAARARRIGPVPPAPPLKASGVTSVALGQPVAIFEGAGPTPTFAGALFVSHQGKDEVVLRSIDGAVVRSLEVTGLRSSAASPDGNRVAIGQWDSTVHVFDASTGKQISTVKNAEDWVTSVAFSPDGAKLASTGLTEANFGQSRITIDDAQTGSNLVTRDFESSTEAIHCLAFTPDGSRLASLFNKKLEVIDAKSGATLLEEEAKVSWNTLLPIDDRHALVLLWNGVGIIDLATANVVSKTKLSDGLRSDRAQLNQRKTLAAVLVRKEQESALHVYSLSPLALLASLPIPDASTETIANGGVAFARDDAGIIVVGETKTFWVPLR